MNIANYNLFPSLWEKKKKKKIIKWQYRNNYMSRYLCKSFILIRIAKACDLHQDKVLTFRFLETKDLLLVDETAFIPHEGYLLVFCAPDVLKFFSAPDFDYIDHGLFS